MSHPNRLRGWVRRLPEWRRRNLRRESFHWKNLRGRGVCFLPLAACLTILLFFSFQWATKGWRVKATNEGVLSVGQLLRQPAARERFANKLALEQRDVKDWESAVSASGLVNWRFMTGLVLTVMFWALVIAGYVIWQAPRTFTAAERVSLLAGLLAACGLAFGFADRAGLAENATVVVRQFLCNIEEHLNGGQLVHYEMRLLLVGYTVVVYLLCASGATLVPPDRPRPEGADESRRAVKKEADFIAARMGHLRLILYVAALALVVTLTRTSLSFHWSLDYLPPLDSFPEKSAELLAARLSYERLGNIATNTLTANAVMNMIVLAALYVPAALVLQRRANELSEWAERQGVLEAAPAKEGKDAEGPKADAETGPTPKEREEWLKARGLAFPLKEHLKQLAAILSPLLAGPAAEVLSLLKS